MRALHQEAVRPLPLAFRIESPASHLHTLHTLRYVGWSYESPDQKIGAFDAKGIETVRRDGCPAEAKLLEKCLRLLFTTNDLSAVKAYALRQFDKTLSGRASLQV